MAITPEARFITLCVREPDAVQPHELRSAAAAVRDWDAVAATAARHRVAAFVRPATERNGILLPAPAQQALHEAALTALARVMRLNAELERVVGALAAAALPVIVLKGPALARTIYPRVALRPYGDIDLTVQDRHEDAVMAVLLDGGFDEVPFGPEGKRRARAGHVHEGAALHRVFVAGDGDVVIDLHTDPLQLGLKSTGEVGRWRRAVPVPRLPGGLMLCPEDQVVHLSVHSHKHGFERLIWLKDLDLLLRAHGDGLDWDLVVSVARQDGARASIWYALGLAAQLLGAPIPRPVLARLRPAPLVSALYGLVWPTSRIIALNGQRRRRAIQFNAGESWRGMLPSMVLMGRRRIRARAIVRAVLHR